MRQRGFVTGQHEDEIDIIATLDVIKDELEIVQNSFDSVIEPELVDSYTYEILALETKYCYYLNLYKQRCVGGVPAPGGAEVG